MRNLIIMIKYNIKKCIIPILVIALSIIFSTSVYCAPNDWQLPFAKGVTVRITQTATASHLTTGNNFALDFGLGAISNRAIYSPTDGRIEVYNECNRNHYRSSLECTCTGYGKYVKIFTNDGNTILMAHLDSINISNGQINKGTYIGVGGNTGNSSGAHLHFEVYTPYNSVSNIFGKSINDFYIDSTHTRTEDSITPPPQEPSNPTQPESNKVVFAADDKNGSGLNYSFSVGNYSSASQFGDLQNDSISHLKIDSGYVLIAYNDSNFRGSEWVFLAGTHNLETDFNGNANNQISSFKIMTTADYNNHSNSQNNNSQVVTVADDKNGYGITYSYKTGEYPAPSYFGDIKNDMISYIKVSNSYVFIGYENENFGGTEWVFEAGTHNLELTYGSAANNRISSFKIMTASDFTNYKNSIVHLYSNERRQMVIDSYSTVFGNLLYPDEATIQMYLSDSSWNDISELIRRHNHWLTHDVETKSVGFGSNFSDGQVHQQSKMMKFVVPQGYQVWWYDGQSDRISSSGETVLTTYATFFITR